MKAPEEYNHQPPLPPRRHQQRGFTMMVMGRGGTPRETSHRGNDVPRRRPILPAPMDGRSNNRIIPLSSRTENGPGLSTQGNLRTVHPPHPLLPRDTETLVLLEDFPDPFVPSASVTSPQSPELEALTQLEREHRLIQEQLQLSPRQDAIDTSIQRDLEAIQRELIRREFQEAVGSGQGQHPLLSMMESLLTNPPPTPVRFPTPRPIDDATFRNLDDESRNPWIESSDDDSDSTVSGTNDNGPTSILDDYLNMPTFHHFTTTDRPFEEPKSSTYEDSDKLSRTIREDRFLKRTFAPNVPFQSEQIKCTCSCNNSADGELWSPENCICYQQLLLNQQHASYLALRRQQRRPIR